MRDGAGSPASLLEQRQACDPGTVLAHPSVVEHYERSRSLQRKTARAQAAVRTTDDEASLSTTYRLGDAVDEQDINPRTVRQP